MQRVEALRLFGNQPWEISDITWEETTQTNIGLDLSLFSSRINFTFDAYLKETSGLLLDVELPDYSGYDFIRLNAGEMENKGLGICAFYCKRR